MAYFLFDLWKRDPKSIPATVTVDDAPVTDDEIRALLKTFDPKTANIFVQIYTVTPQLEGWLYDQLNFDQKPPQRAVGIALNPSKTPARRFVEALMRKSAVFSEREVETRANNIGTDSRKLTTNSTLVGAVQDSSKLLLKLEQENPKTGAYTDFTNFVVAFFDEYAKHFPEVLPDVSGDDRNASRKTSFAISNIMFHPLMRLARDLWLAYRREKRPWAKHSEWRDAIARIAGPTAKKKGVKVMDRTNPDWEGKILIQTYSPTGVTGTTLSNTRQTREAAYQYLLDVSRVGMFVKDTEATTNGAG